MKIYRMVLTEHGASLKAPGVSGRWNSGGKFVLYCSQSRSLSCLENIVHRTTEGLFRNFFILVVEVPDTLVVETMAMKSLPDGWQMPFNYQPCQRLGDEWVTSNRSCLVKVPSAIIHQEFNYLINVKHPDFRNIRIADTEEFTFDPRLRL